MSNKLQQILEEFEEQYGDLGMKDPDESLRDTSIKNWIKEKLVEYARSIINIETNPLIELPLSDYVRLESAWDKKHKEMFDRIDQDLHSLTDTK